jgi:hypothetical protein
MWQVPDMALLKLVADSENRSLTNMLETLLLTNCGKHDVGEHSAPAKAGK